MTNNFDNNMKNITINLKELGFSSNEIKVYLAITKLGEAKASAIAQKAGISRTTAISILDRLEKENFISTHKYRGVIYYWIESPATIEEIYKNKVKVAQNLNSVLTSLYRTEFNLPNAKVLDTREGVKNFLVKTIAEAKPKSIIYTIDSPHQGNYRKILDDDFYQVLIESKGNKSITTYTLVPRGTFEEIEPYKLTKQNIVIKELPEGLEFESSIWFLDDVVVLFSGNPPFIVAIKHQSVYRGLKSVFDFLWSVSQEKKEAF